MRAVLMTLAIVAILVTLGGPVASEPSLQQVNRDTQIDWTNHIYIAKGEGAMPTPEEEPNRARAYLRAKGYARAAAVANLMMAIEGTTVDYNSCGKDYMADETIHQKIEGFVKHVELISTDKEKIQGGTLVVVEVHAPMFGQDGTPGSVMLGEEFGKRTADSADAGSRPDHDFAIKKMEPKTTPEMEAIFHAKPSEPGRPYTSLIIDATGYKLDRCMSPRIRRQDGSEVWGTVKADLDFVEDHGIVVYATTLSEAKNNSRCGDNPLLIRAVGRAGGKFASDPVIGDADAALLLAENGKSKFLDRFCVVFVKDGNL